MLYKGMLINWLFLKEFIHITPLNNYYKHYNGLAETMFTNLVIT